jgi:putative drug exporter of the RND superfamily
MLYRLGTLISHWWPVVLFAWVAGLVFLYAAATPFQDVEEKSIVAQLPTGSASSRGNELLDAAFPGIGTHTQACIVIARPDGPFQDGDWAVADQIRDRFNPNQSRSSATSPNEDSSVSPDSPVASHSVVGVLTYNSPGVGLTLVSSPSEAGQATLVILKLRTDMTLGEHRRLMAELDSVLHWIRINPASPQGLEFGVTGPTAIGVDLQDATGTALHRTGWFGLAVLCVVLCLACRRLELVVATGLTIAAAVFVSWRLTLILGAVGEATSWFRFDLLEITELLTLVVSTGVASSGAIFMIVPYREYLRRGERPHEALRNAYPRAASALLWGTGVSCLTFLGTTFSQFGNHRHWGQVMSVSLAVIALACLTLLPALLCCVGSIVRFTPLGGPSRSTSKDRLAGPLRRLRFHRLRELAAFIVVRRPGAVLALVVIGLAVLAYIGSQATINYDLLRSLSRESSSVQGARLLEQYFPSGETGPIVVLAYRSDAEFDEDGRMFDEITPLAVQLYETSFYDSRGEVVHPIAGVRSLRDPLGAQGQGTGILTSVRAAVLSRGSYVRESYLSHGVEYEGQATRFEIVSHYSPYSEESLRLLDELESSLQQQADDPESPWYGTEFHTLGTTASIRDLAEVLDSDQRRLYWVMPLVATICMALAVRRIDLALWLGGSLIAVFFASLGASSLILRYWEGDSFAGIDWRTPFLLFTLSLAFGHEQSVLVLRMLREGRQDDPLMGMRRAYHRAASPLIWCSAATTALFVAMCAGSLDVLIQLGVTTFIAVALSTCVIRLISLPAFFVLAERLRNLHVSSEKYPSKEDSNFPEGDL